MAFTIADRVRETATTTGTGSFTLAGAVTGFRTFSTGVGNNDTCYLIFNREVQSEWEVAFGTVSGGTSLSRGTVIASSTGSTVNFSAGIKDVVCVAPARAYGWTAYNTSLIVTSTLDPTAGYTAYVNPQWLTNRTIINGYVDASVGSSTLTTTLLDEASSTPSSTSPVLVQFRSATITTGHFHDSMATITSATTLVLSNGSTLGTANSIPFRLWIVGIRDQGVFRMGLINCRSGTNVCPLRDDVLMDSMPEGGTGGADSAQVLYTENASTVTITNASPAVVTWTAHGLVANTAVVFSTSGALPTGLMAGTIYYVISAGLGASTFRVSATIGGAAINTSSAGSGTHTGHAGVYQCPIRILGYLEWSSGLATAGAWSAGPTKVQLYHPGICLPGQIVQGVNVVDGAVATGTTTIPFDNTIPQGTGSPEGTQFMSLTITPTSPANVLVVDTVSNLASNTGSTSLATALFRDSGADAVATVASATALTNGMLQTSIHYEVLAGAVTATTFKSRSGGSSALTVTFNGQNAAARFGGTMPSYMKITEVMG